MNVVSPSRLGDGFRVVALRHVADTATGIGLVVGERLLDVAMLPVTLGGLGTREAALVALLAGQVAAPDALAAGLLYSLFTYVLLGAFGLLFTRRALRY